MLSGLTPSFDGVSLMYSLTAVFSFSTFSVVLSLVLSVVLSLVDCSMVSFCGFVLFILFLYIGSFHG